MAQISGWLLGGLLVRMAIAIWLPVGFDEAYYYLYTQHLDWSYFDHPVMVALSTGLGLWLTGQVSPFTIRLGALLSYTGALLLLFLTSRRLFSVQAAVLTVAIASLVPIFAIGFGVLTLPDSPLMLFWAATLYIAAVEFFRAANFDPSKSDSSNSYCPSYRLALIGLLVGLACLSKYHGLVLGAGLVGFCLTSPPHRKALRSPWMLVAGLLFAPAIAPIVIWNQQHDWISLRFQSGRAIPNHGYNLLELLGVFGVGIAYLFPTFGIPLWWVSLRAVWMQRAEGRMQRAEGRRQKAEGREQKAEHSPFIPSSLHPFIPSSLHPFIPSSLHPSIPSSFILYPLSFILWLSLPLMLGFTLMGGYRPILPTWAMPGFFGATLLLGAAAAEWQQKSPRGVRRWLWGSGLAIAALLIIALSHLTLGTFQKPSQYALLGGFVPASADASIQLVDIGQIRQGVAASAQVRAALERADFVFTNEIFLAGQVAMAIAPFQPPPMDCFTDDIRGFAFWFTNDQWVGKSGLYFTSNRQPNADKYAGYFQQIRKIGALPIRRGGELVEMIQVYDCQMLLKPYPKQLQTPPI